jgi:hypothetical protein
MCRPCKTIRSAGIPFILHILLFLRPIRRSTNFFFFLVLGVFFSLFLFLALAFGLFDSFVFSPIRRARNTTDDSSCAIVDDRSRRTLCLLEQRFARTLYQRESPVLGVRVYAKYVRLNRSRRLTPNQKDGQF